MRAERLRLRSFRSYERASLELGEAVTVLCGANGAGKTNVLEGLYFAATGRSCRTGNDRELIRFGAQAARAELDVVDELGARHELAVGFQAGENKHFTVDCDPVPRLLDHPLRPLMSVFLPERLELIKGAPALRRSHLDNLVAALWPARAQTRRDHARVLAQRNALLLRIKGGFGSQTGLDAWDRELAKLSLQLTADRDEAVSLLAGRLPELGEELGLPEPLTVRYRARYEGLSEDEIVHRLREARGSDGERGFTQSGPHRDDLVSRLGERELRTFGSQGQQRIALLAIIVAERELLADIRGSVPMLLLDDVMSELDSTRRRLLVERVRVRGQTLITATEADHVPLSGDGCLQLEVADGSIAATAGAGAA